MKLTSPAFENNASLPKKYSCDGEGVNPPLAFSDIPKDTKSLILIVDDPDAPNGTFTHWILYNISPSITEIAENAVPKNAMQGKTSLGKPGFVAACPPHGQHRYFFKLYALDAVFSEEKMDVQALDQAMSGHILASAELIGLYARQ